MINLVMTAERDCKADSPRLHKLGPGRSDRPVYSFPARGRALHTVDSLRTFTMHTHRPQDDVKVAVYAAQMAPPAQLNTQDIIGVLCISLGTLMAVWLNASF